MIGWQKYLEVVGAELFQRYRKRLLVPGIALEIRDDYPGLSMPDVLIRVHAGRQIIREGDDFRALEAIRSGKWQRTLAQMEKRHTVIGRRRDPVSRSMIRFGGLLFAAFCLLFLTASMAAGPGAWLLLALGCGLGAAVSLRSRRRSRGPGVSPRVVPDPHARAVLRLN